MRPLLRRALHAYFWMSRGMTLGVRAAVLDGAGQVCLIRHTYTPGWHLPGGGVETGETALDALLRETREEAGIEITGPPVLHGVFFNGAVSRRDHVLVYAVRAFRVVQIKQPDREIAGAGFFPLADLPEGTTAGTRARLAEIAAGRAGSPVW